MRKILFAACIGATVLFPVSVFAKPCADIVADSNGAIQYAQCSLNCVAPSTPADGECAVQGMQCCGTPSIIANEAPAKDPGLSVEAMCTCSFVLTTPPLVPFPTKMCSSILPADKCVCGESQATCKFGAMTAQADCTDANAEMKNFVSTLNSLPGTVAKSSGCSWAGSTKTSKTAVKAKACVPKAVAKAGLGQLDLSGVSSCCISNGDCTLDDIVTTGASFANLLTQLSAAFFFATFVYGGAMYLLSFGDKGRIDKGKKAITGAAIGMLIVLMAWTIVNYIANALKAKT